MISTINSFDGLYSTAEASALWHLNESTIRKKIASGKLIPEVDVKKFGKQWVITEAAMIREYKERPTA